MPRFVYDLADALGRYAHVVVLAPDAPGAKRRERMGSVDVRRFRYFLPASLQRLALGRGMPDNLGRSWLARFQVPWFLLRQTMETRRLVDEERIDVINAHWLLPQGLTAAWARRGRRTARLVLHAHGGDAHTLTRIPGGRRLARYLVGQADVLFVAGSGIKTALDTLLRTDSGATIQPMGVRLGEFGGRHGQASAAPTAGEADLPRSFLLYVGRMIELKGVEYLVRALPIVQAEHPEVGLVLIGDGPRREAIEREVTRLGLSRSVRFLGRRPHEDVIRMMRRCRAVVVPSIVDGRGRTEGMPTVIVEAMAAGARVVATSVGGIPDVLRDRENGWVCRQKDPEELANAIGMALDDPTPSLLAANALTTAERFDWDRIARNYMNRISNTTGFDAD